MIERTPYRVDLRSMAALCESNYLRLGRLLNAVFPGQEDGVAVGGWVDEKIDCGFTAHVHLPEIDAALCLQICDVAPYTTTIRIQKRPLKMACSAEALDFFDGKAGSGDPFSGWSVSLNIQVKVYHDLRMAEVADYAGAGVGRSRNDYPNPAMLAIDERDQQNRMLAEWLRYALENGVKPVAGFDSAERLESVFQPANDTATDADKVGPAS